MATKLRLDGWISLFLFAMFAGLLYEASGYDVQVIRYPQVLLYIALALSVVTFLQSLLKQKKASGDEISLRRYGPVAVVFLMIAFYAVGVIFTGFAIPTALFMIIMMVYFGERRWLTIGVVTVVFLLLLYGVFVRFLAVPLPILPVHIV